MKNQEFNKIVSPFLPKEALDYCCHLWLQHAFHFKITRDRKSKLGDFRYTKANNKYTVTVNRGLNPYSFLITYLHEVAHVVTYRQFKNSCKPHGREWQENFRKLAEPLFDTSTFPSDIKLAFQNYLKDPAASTSGCAPLTLALRKYDQEADPSQQILATLAPGCKFIFKDRTFIKVGKKRTRALCKDLGNGRNYLISEVAQVCAVA